jgi:hypothetical protein
MHYHPTDCSRPLFLLTPQASISGKKLVFDANGSNFSTKIQAFRPKGYGTFDRRRASLGVALNSPLLPVSIAIIVSITKSNLYAGSSIVR